MPILSQLVLRDGHGTALARAWLILLSREHGSATAGTAARNTAILPFFHTFPPNAIPRQGQRQVHMQASIELNGKQAERAKGKHGLYGSIDSSERGEKRKVE